VHAQDAVEFPPVNPSQTSWAGECGYGRDPASGPRIVVGVTDDPAALRALRWAFDVAILNDALLIVITAYSPPRAVVSMDGATYFDIHDAEATARVVQTQLIEAELHVDLPNHHIHQIVAYGDPITALVAESSDADLLVIGRRASRIRRLLTGSVSKRCANRAACPVVIVRTQAQAETSGPIIARRVSQLTETIPEIPNLPAKRPDCSGQDHPRIETRRRKR